MSDLDTVLNAARERGLAAIAATPRIDYDAANRAYRRQKAALTRAVNSGDSEQVKRAVVKAVREWRQPGMFWPDGWSRWQIALDDAMPWNARIAIEDIR